MKIQIVGSVDYRFEVNFWVVNAGGKMIHSNLINVKSLLEAYEVIEKFYQARCKVSNSSTTLFGGGFPVYSFGWLARHSCLVEIYDSEDDSIIERVFIQHPYLEHINNLVN